jgi:hypothetical protein
MDKEAIKEIAIQLKDIGASLKDLGAEGFTTYVGWFHKARIASFITDFIIFITSGIGIYLLIKFAMFCIKRERESGENWDCGYIMAFIFAGLLSILFIGSFFTSLNALYGIIAPEYYALMKLLGK